MLTLKMLRDDPKAVIEKLKIKNFDAQPIVDKVLELDARRRSLQTESDALLAQQKQKAAEIGGLMKQGQREAAEAAKAEVAALKARSAELLAQMDEAAAELEAQLVLMPNTPCSLVKPGKGAEDNEIVKMGGPEVKLPEGALPHWELAKKYDIIDFDLGVKITGAGFPVYKGKGAKLQRALINFFLDCNTAAGYKEVEPPVMVNRDSGFGTGQLPEVDDFYMVPTAEVPVTNIFRDVILAENEIPQRLTAYTPCFRREAGSYGKDVRGLNRLHQFDKVEIVRVEKPEDSYKALDDMVAHVESLVNKLGLKQRILFLNSLKPLVLKLLPDSLAAEDNAGLPVVNVLNSVKTVDNRLLPVGVYTGDFVVYQKDFLALFAAYFVISVVARGGRFAKRNGVLQAVAHFLNSEINIVARLHVHSYSKISFGNAA